MIVHETLGLMTSGAVLVLTVAVFWTLSRYLGAYHARLNAEHPSPETRALWKRRQTQMFATVGIWEVSIGFLLIVAMGDVASGVGPTMVGVFFLAYGTHPLWLPRLVNR